MPASDVTARYACVACAMLTIPIGDEASKYPESCAFVAVTLHVPTLELVNTCDPTAPLTAQATAEPSATAKLNAPVPDPPDAVSVRGVP